MFTVLAAGCATTAPRVRHERSVKPGINDPYKNPVVDEWVARFESESREIFKHRRRILKAAGIRRGQTVADIGAGTGLFVPLLSEAVGPEGKVLAVDIVPKFLAYIDKRAEQAGLTNVQTVLCDEDSVRLPPASIDVAFVCDTYHHFEYPHGTLRSIFDALKPGGELIVIDFIRDPNVSRAWILKHVRADEATVRAEIESAGFVYAVDQPDDSFLKENYILRFRRPVGRPAD
ncbi:MAG: methyltransferase domain-containing protein [Planctomycetota bacterium]|nr:MAG: methyltransferase domain-containing protein [Planctomycetota bacterium]